jgi:hypothetical protein
MEGAALLDYTLLLGILLVVVTAIIIWESFDRDSCD